MLFYRQSYKGSSRRGVCIDHVLTKQGLGVTKGAHGVTKGEKVKGRAKKVIVVWKKICKFATDGQKIFFLSGDTCVFALQ
jgi:hypothetical protein